MAQPRPIRSRLNRREDLLVPGASRSLFSPLEPVTWQPCIFLSMRVWRIGSAAGCMLGPLVPLPVVAAPLWLAGVKPDRALGVSAIGLLGGAAGFILGGLASNAIGINSYALALTASSMVHSGIVLAMVR